MKLRGSVGCPQMKACSLLVANVGAQFQMRVLHSLSVADGGGVGSRRRSSLSPAKLHGGWAKREERRGHCSQGRM